MTTENKVKVGNHLDASDAALARSVTSLQSNLKNLEGSATSPGRPGSTGTAAPGSGQEIGRFPTRRTSGKPHAFTDDVKQ